MSTILLILDVNDQGKLTSGGLEAVSAAKILKGLTGQALSIGLIGGSGLNEATDKLGGSEAEKVLACGHEALGLGRECVIRPIAPIDERVRSR